MTLNKHRAAATVLLIVMIVISYGRTALARKPAKSPLKVFILAGQSNMEGQGKIAIDPKRNEGKGSLEYLVKDPATAERMHIEACEEIAPEQLPSADYCTMCGQKWCSVRINKEIREFINSGKTRKA